MTSQELLRKEEIATLRHLADEGPSWAVEVGESVGWSAVQAGSQLTRLRNLGLVTSEPTDSVLIWRLTPRGRATLRTSLT